jgi:hypothetical protein
MCSKNVIIRGTLTISLVLTTIFEHHNARLQEYLQITIKRRYTLALELQVGHSMPVALWVRWCIVGVS